MSENKSVIENKTTEELEEELISLQNELGAIECTIGKIENELFYRKNPELTRPYTYNNQNKQS